MSVHHEDRNVFVIYTLRTEILYKVREQQAKAKSKQSSGVWIAAEIEKHAQYH